MIRRAICNVAVGAWYPEGQDRLFYSLEDRDENATRLFWRDEYPPGARAHQDSLYGFKVYALLRARELGHQQALWLDASCWLVKPLNDIWARLDEDGYYFEPDGNTVGPWTGDRCHELLGLTRDETMCMPLFEGKSFGLDFRDETANAWLDEMHRLEQEGAFFGSLTNHQGEVSSDPRCLGHRGDISVGSPLIDSFGMRLQTVKRVWFPSNGGAPDHVCLMAQGM